MSTSLPVSALVRVNVFLTPSAARAQNLSTLLVLGSSAVIDVVERFRDYADLTAVAVDFGNDTPEYLAAQSWFAQTPQPAIIKIGRWAKTATSGKLNGGTLSAAAQALGPWNAITTGGFTYTKNGAGPTAVTGLNFSAATTMNGIAAIVTAALVGATMVWNAAFSRFELTSATTGATSTISFLTAPGAGVDVSTMLAMKAADGGYRADGIAAETAVAAATLFDSNYGQQWYGLTIPEAVDADHLAVAAYVEATNTKHTYWITTQDAASLNGVSTSDIGYQLHALGYSKTIVQYSSATAYAVQSAAAKALGVDWTANNTANTLMYKNEPGVVAEAINTTQATALKDKCVNVFVEYQNDTSILQHGTVASGRFIDEITGTDWLAVTVQQAVYNALYTSPTKVPQTDAGVQVLTTAIDAVCAQGVNNGLIAPGVWNSGGFGVLKQGDFMPKGFYVYAPRISAQNPADRAARKSPTLQVAVKLAGAIHEVVIALTVNA